MITSLKVENFKGLSQVELPVLKRISLIGGKNNVGKTTLLESILTLHSRYDPTVFLKQFHSRGITSLPLKSELLWGPIFTNFDMGSTIVISVLTENRPETLAIQYVEDNPFSDRVEEGDQVHPKGYIRTDQTPNRNYRLSYRYERRPMVETKSYMIREDGSVSLFGKKGRFLPTTPTTMTYSRVQMNPNELAQSFGLLDVVGETDIILQFLKNIEPNLRGLSSINLGETTVLHGDVGRNRKVPIYYMGDGISRLLQIIVQIATHRDGIVLIDEFENGIHHSVLRKVWAGVAQAAQHYNCQVIVTTHSYECLQAAYEGIGDAGLTDDLAYIRLDRIGEEIKAKTFDHEKLGFALENDLEVR